MACRNLKRDFIGIEIDEKYFKIAQQRIELGIEPDRTLPSKKGNEDPQQLTFF